LPERTNVAVLEDEKEYDRAGEPEIIMEEYDEFAGVNEYAVSGWLKFPSEFAQQNWHSIFRLTINPPEIQKDLQLAGDRTLALFMSKQDYHYTTYNYGDLDRNDDD
jgi:hypothetical protein